MQRFRIRLDHRRGDRTNGFHQCDEKKPSCTRCVLGLMSCLYPPAKLFVHESSCRGGLPRLRSPQLFTLSSSRIAPSFSDNIPLSEASASCSPALIESSCRIKTEEEFLPPSDIALYQHYLQHTSHISTQYQNDKTAFEIYIPTLALQSKIVFDSILALSASCMCLDMIAKRPGPDTAAVNHVLMAGYQHYNLASEKTRDLISQPDILKPEPLLASSAFLVGFATSSQLINHWIESRKSTREPFKRLSASLRDMLVISKGLRTTLQVVRRDPVSSSHEMTNESEFLNETVLEPPEFRPPPTTPSPSHTHFMYPTIAATSQEAFSRLQERLDSATSLYHRNDAAMPACAEAFQRLSTIRNLAFSSTAPSEPLSLDNASMLPQVPPWLRTYIGRPIILSPDKPLTRPFLTFLIMSSQEYLDLLLPLLDESLECPMESIPDGMPELTEVQALALDIWAHWCVLMFLVEEESWVIGNLPFILLNGMLNRYSDNFVARLWPEHYQGQGRWWPASMLACLREIKGC